MVLFAARASETERLAGTAAPVHQPRRGSLWIDHMDTRIG